MEESMEECVSSDFATAASAGADQPSILGSGIDADDGLWPIEVIPARFYFRHTYNRCRTPGSMLSHPQADYHIYKVRHLVYCGFDDSMAHRSGSVDCPACPVRRRILLV